MNHGHVVPNPDGSLARCGGPAICSDCAREKAQVEAATQVVSEAIKEGLKHTVGEKMTTEQLKEEDLKKILKDSFKACGIDGFMGVFKIGDTWRIEGFDLDLVQQAGAVKFMQTHVECKLVDVCSPKPKRDTVPFDK